MAQIRTVQGVRIAEHHPCLLETDAVLGVVAGGLASISLEHDSVYTKPGRLPFKYPVIRRKCKIRRPVT
jgi:hypothetical protein